MEPDEPRSESGTTGRHSTPVRVVLADEHTMFREGLASILASRGGIEVVGHTSTGEEAFALIQKSRPDVVITQLDMELTKAREILSGIRSASPDSRIVVLTMFDNLHYVQALAKLGVNAYLHKSSSSEELLATIDAVSRDPGGGNVVISMPRGFLERMEEGPTGLLSERRRRCWCSPPAGSPTARSPRSCESPRRP